MGGQDATPSQCILADYRRAGCWSFYISNETIVSYLTTERRVMLRGD